MVAVENLPRLAAALGVASDGLPLTAVDGSGPPPRELLGEIAALPAPAGTADADDEDTDPLTELIAEWLRFYGPLAPERLAASFALDDDRLRDLLETLTTAETIVVDRFRAGEEAPRELCDGENLERLLRLLRAAARPEFRALELDRLPQFLAAWQGLATPADGVEGLERALSRLLGYPAPARLWETELLPARLEPYYPSWLDSLLQESELVWQGCGSERLTFVFPEDRELLREAPLGAGEDDAATGTEAGGAELDELFPTPGGRYPLAELARHSGLDTARLTEDLWRLAWEGGVTSTGYGTVRQGILNRFRVEPAAGERWISERRREARKAARRPGRQRRFERWRSSRPFTGDWYRADAGEAPEPRDALELEELNKERVHLLVDRYGVVFRELLERELPALRWGRLFRSLRLMELSGELVAGQFFDGIPGLQFASPAAFQRLVAGLPDDAVVWMSAADPASPAGLALEPLQGRYPPRLASSHLVFHGPRLVVTSRRHAAELEIAASADDPRLGHYLGFVRHLLGRRFAPRRGLAVETINGEPAAAGPYAARLVELFSASREGGTLKLRRRFRDAAAGAGS